MTQLEAAKAGKITEEMRVVAETEHISVKELMGLIAKGEVIIAKNETHSRGFKNARESKRKHRQFPGRLRCK
jgi:thiamine biosynthesis protein ThiC